MVNNEKFTFLEANKYLLETHQNYSTNPNELNTAVEIYHSVFASRLIYLKLLKILTFINPQSEGPMKYHPSVCPFICLSFWTKSVQNGPKMRVFKLYEKSTQEIFLSFCMKLH